jgi:hypothetical protein
MKPRLTVALLIAVTFVSSAAAQTGVSGTAKPKAVIGGAAVQVNPVVATPRGVAPPPTAPPKKPQPKK